MAGRDTGKTYSQLWQDPEYQAWCRAQGRTDYSDPELMAEYYNYLNS
jgi:hypothetical protein